ncbi:MAG: hypothetical protein KJ042_05970 [Deltaproteobacteria bacterium]|nr:hypothetical protein [Deltaproteobacteria bacterium]
MTSRVVLAIFATVAMTGCASMHSETRLHQVGAWAYSADEPAFRRCAPVEWADVTDHYGMALNDIVERRYRSAAHHLDVAEAQYARALEYVKNCPPGGRNPSSFPVK